MGGGGLQYCRMVRGSLTEKVTCEQRFEGREGVNHMDVWVKGIPRRGKLGPKAKVLRQESDWYWYQQQGY